MVTLLVLLNTSLQFGKNAACKLLICVVEGLEINGMGEAKGRSILLGFKCILSVKSCKIHTWYIHQGMVSLMGQATSANRPCRAFMLETAQEGTEVLERTGGWGQPFWWQPAAGY